MTGIARSVEISGVRLTSTSVALELPEEEDRTDFAVGNWKDGFGAAESRSQVAATRGAVDAPFPEACHAFLVHLYLARGKDETHKNASHLCRSGSELPDLGIPCSAHSGTPRREIDRTGCHALGRTHHPLRVGALAGVSEWAFLCGLKQGRGQD